MSMANQVYCTCGVALAVPVGSDGKRLRCPKCSAILHVPIVVDAVPPVPVEDVEAIPPSTPAGLEPQWYYSLRGDRLGPKTRTEIESLIREGKIAPETHVWSGQGDWVTAGSSELKVVFSSLREPGPPPLAASAVDNSMAWAIVSVPIVGAIIEAFLPGQVAKIGNKIFYFYWAVNTALCLLDGRRLRSAGHPAPSNWWVLLIPGYLWKRAQLVRQKQIHLAAWLVAFVISITASAATTPEANVYVQCNVADDGFVCTVTHQEGNANAHACWDVLIKCANGNVVTGSACHDVQTAQTSRRFIPESSIRGLERCDVPISFDVANVQVTLIQ